MAPASPSQRQQPQEFPINYCRSSDFLEVSQSPTFIDKTALIYDYFDHEKKFLIFTAPPGYGKSTNLDMVKRYVEIDVDPETGKVSTFNHSKNYRIFKKNNLKIHQAQQQFFKLYFAKFAVIHFSLKNVYGETVASLLRKHAENLSETYQQHRYLMKSGELTGSDKERLSAYLDVEKCTKLSTHQLECGLVFLAKMLVKHYKRKKVFLFIDDYDYPCAKLSVDTSIKLNDYYVFFDKVFNSITKPNSSIARGLFVGRTGDYIFQIDFKRIAMYSFFNAHCYDEFFGLNTKEVVDLLIQFNIYTKETLNNLIKYYSVSVYDKAPLICTSAMMQYLDRREFLDFFHLSDICYMNKIKQHLIYSPIRHVIDKLLTLRCWSPEPYIENVPNKIKLNCEHIIDHLKCYGFCHSTIVSDANYLCITTEFRRNNLKQLINDYYGDDLNLKLEQCAKIFDNVAMNPPRSFYFNFIELFRLVAIKYSNKFPTERYASIQCMADIIAKTEYYSYHLTNVENFPFKICCSYATSINPCKMERLCLCVEHDTPIESVLATAVNKCTNANDNISVGISTDAKFRFAIGWVVGTDLNKAQYFSFK